MTTLDVLKRGDASSTNAIIGAFADSKAFGAFADAETKGILRRDAEDGEKLGEGIQLAVQKGVLEATPPVEELCCIDVLGKSSDDICTEIMNKLGDVSSGCVMVLQGLSGTGKGTTVARLQKSLNKAFCWSNGNVFRSLTLLAVAHCEKEGIELANLESILTPELLGELMGRLEFGKFDGDNFDTRITMQSGETLLVSQVQNTTLKEPKVGKNIPTVARVTQGEVVKFAASAAETMSKEGFNVLVEGRAQTLDYVRTQHRFELQLSDETIIGKRRAAQRMMAHALKALDGGDADESAIHKALESALAELA